MKPVDPTEQMTYRWTEETYFGSDAVQDKKFLSYLKRLGITFRDTKITRPFGWPVFEYTGTKSALLKMAVKCFEIDEETGWQSAFYEELEPTEETQRLLAKSELTKESLAVEMIVNP